MDICSHCIKSVSEDLNIFNDLEEQSSESAKQCTCATIGNGTADDIEYALGESLHIQDAEESVNKFDGDDNSDVEEGNIGREVSIEETKSGRKTLCKCMTFPFPSKLVSSDGSTDEEDDIPGAVLQGYCNCALEEKNAAYSRLISLPTPLKLVSAMKGTREKQQGTPTMKLAVKWAPDVYDPPPTILSHAVKSKNQQRSKNEKKNGKKKQKGSGNSGKASRGSGAGKDKKQFRKLVGSSDKCYKSLDASDRLVDYADPSDDFDVGSPDSYCGSSFLRKSFNKVHMSVAEAL